MLEECFSGYEKMANADNPTSWRKGLDEHKEHVQQAQWVVTEKVHGANFSFVIQPNQEQELEVRCARRKGFIGKGENFFGHERVFARLRDNMTAVWELVLSKVSTSWSVYQDTPTGVRVQRVTVFGELFGGTYSHPDVDSVPGMQRVQYEVEYSPEVRFMAFDVAVHFVGEPGPDGNKQMMVHKRYMDYDEVMCVLDQAGVPFMAPVAVCSLEQALAMDVNSMQSTLPALFGLPTLENNVAEGVVIKLLQESTCIKLIDGERAIIKLKSKSFRERSHPSKRFEPDELQQQVLSRICDARLSCVISKIGSVQPNRASVYKVALLLIQDAMDDLDEHWTNKVSELPKARRKALHKRANARARKLTWVRARRS